MKIPSTQPLTFATNDLLAPSDLNDVFRFAGQALDEASSKRWAKATVVIPFMPSIAVPYTEATVPAAVRTVRFLCGQTCVIERAFLRANLVSTAAVEVNITAASGGATPAGATTPWLSTLAAVSSPTTDVSDTNPDRVLLVAGTEYIIAVSSTGTFTLGRFDVELHTATDRWTPAGTLIAPTYSPTLFTDASAPNATVVAANISTLTTETNKLANNVLAATPMFFQVHSLLSGTDIDLRTFPIPRFASTRAQSRVVRMFLRVEMAAIGGVGQTVSATLRNAGGTSLQAVSVSVNGVSTGVSQDSTAISIPVAGVGVSAGTTTDDYKLEFANSSAGTAAAKVTCFLWLSR